MRPGRAAPRGYALTSTGDSFGTPLPRPSAAFSVQSVLIQ